jgi:hypothetical protein
LRDAINGELESIDFGVEGEFELDKVGIKSLHTVDIFNIFGK